MNSKFTIERVESEINRLEQYFRLFLKERPRMPLLYKYSHLCNISVNEFEILSGSFCIPVYFKIGDKLKNGKVISERNKFYNIKKWDFLLNGSIEECRARNRDLLLIFETIKQISVFKTKYLGAYTNNFINITVIENDNHYLFTTNELNKLTNLKQNEFDLLVGAFICPECYKMGEVSDDTGWPVWGDPGTTIIKSLNLRLSPSQIKN
jgi:hypothetical protein